VLSAKEKTDDSKFKEGPCRLQTACATVVSTSYDAANKSGSFNCLTYHLLRSLEIGLNPTSDIEGEQLYWCMLASNGARSSKEMAVTGGGKSVLKSSSRGRRSNVVSNEGSSRDGLAAREWGRRSIRRRFVEPYSCGQASERQRFRVFDESVGTFFKQSGRTDSRSLSDTAVTSEELSRNVGAGDGRCEKSRSRLGD